MITRKTVLLLGFSQLICWGISYYLIAAFGERIAEDLGWSGTLVYGGFSAALVVMAITSPATGRLIDAHGGRLVMASGSVLMAAGCLGIAFSHSIAVYYVSWVILGIAMRLTLYDAAFAALARIGGAGAKRPISQITLLGGLASTVFWPIGFFLADAFGWRQALLVYALFALLTVPLHLAIPQVKFAEPRHEGGAGPAPRQAPAKEGRELAIAGAVYAFIFMVLNFLNSGMSVHMINILAGLGIAAAVSVWASTLRGIGQSLARVCEVLFGARIHPFTLTIFASAILPFCFILGIASGKAVLAAFIFAFLFGAGNGLLTISRGTLPLVLFDHQTYGVFVGKLLIPSFLLSAASPIVYTMIIEKWGEAASLGFSALLALLVFAASVYLKRRFPIAD
ncbi:MFS transporter [Planococcus sp. FY231025]|uniref:MFS transporter n=1 Tax=Planococcus sp. FY231025 TaxID=3455699 RepID=UPI003F8E5AD0